MQLAVYDKIFVLEGVYRSLFQVNLKIAKLLLILMLLHPWRRIFLNFISFFLFGMFCLTCDVRNLTNESSKLLRKVANRLPFEIRTEKHFRAVETIRFARGLFQCFNFTRFSTNCYFFGSVTYEGFCSGYN